MDNVSFERFPEKRQIKAAFASSIERWDSVSVQFAFFEPTPIEVSRITPLVSS
jgi:hypothetical protein